MPNSIYENVRLLASNVAATWNGGQEIHDRLAEAVGDPRSSPWEALLTLGEDGVTALFASPQEQRQLSEAAERLRAYLSAETWFDRSLARDSRLEALRSGPVAYFCAEFGVADWLPIYSGGLGILAGDMLKEASDMGLPFVGVGLFYRRGYFYQHLNEVRYQTETYPQLDPSRLPLEAALDGSGHPLVVPVPVADRTVYAAVWKLAVGRVTLLLLDTDIDQNESAPDRAIVANLYGGDNETRIQQELVLGIGGVRALKALGIEPAVYSMNEGHAAFLGLELLAGELGRVDFSAALARTRPRVVYTNHTVVPAGNDVFGRDQVQRYVGPYAEEIGIGTERLLGLASPGTSDGFSMAVLAFQMSGKANAVSQLHAQVIPREWPGFAVEAVTNGVHVPTWLGPEVRALLDEWVPDWRGDDPDWDAVLAIPNDRLLTARDAQRRRMVRLVNEAQSEAVLDPEALTVVWARRFAEYKRAWLLASDMGRLARLLGNRERPLQIVISGKSHPRDGGGKGVMQSLLQRLAEDAGVSARVAFVQDYSIRVARSITAGADVWLNTPRKPLEASGTSGMKSSDNGGLQLTVSDGWAAEVDWYGVGWAIAGTSDEADAQQLYWYLEDSVVPTFYDRDSAGVGNAWAEMAKRSMLVTLQRYSARRMVTDYLHKLYLPLVEEQSAAVGAAR